MVGVGKGQNSQDVQKLNRSLVLKVLLREKITTRAHIAEETGLKKATVTNIVNDFINWGAVREVGMSTGKSGRRTILIELAKEKYAIVCGWLKRNEFIFGVCDVYGTCLIREAVKLKEDVSGMDVTNIMVSCLKKYKDSVNDKTILGVAVALPGPYIKRDGKIIVTTGRSNWKEEDIESNLREAFGEKVFLEHDANAAMMAEWDFLRKQEEVDDLLYVMLGHGVGGGIIEHGRMLTGTLGIAGEMGHMSISYNGRRCECGNYGCLETYCTIEAMLTDMRKLLPQYPNSICTEKSNFEEVMSAYQKKDGLARKVVNRVAEYLGYAIASSVNLLNPERVIIGDELPKAAGEDFLEVVKSTVSDRVLPQIYNSIQIQMSSLDNAVLLGICICLMDKLVNLPEIFQNEITE